LAVCTITLVSLKGTEMDDLITIGVIAVAILAVLGLGIKFVISFKSGSKNNFKNVQAGGDVVGRDKVQK
jgi:hypothetical protein